MAEYDETISDEEATEILMTHINDMIDGEEEVAEEVDVHISFTTDAFATIKFRDKDGNDPGIIDILYSYDYEDTWNVYHGPPEWIIPFAGEYKLRFNEEHLSPVFSDAFTEIKFYDSYQSNGMTTSGMFENCSSLVNIDLGGFDTSPVTDLSSMFEDITNLEQPQNPTSIYWSPTTIYQRGDIVYYEDTIYIAAHNVMSAPGDTNDWVELDSEGNIAPKPKISKEVKENTAGISTGDIPE